MIKFDISNNFNLDENWKGVIPPNVRFYWKMLPPKRSVFGGYTGAASDLNRQSG